MFEISRRTADRYFSKVVKFRDNNICVRCHHKHGLASKGLHVSHFFSRAREGTRFNLKNVDSLCYACHQLWGHGEGRPEYIKFKKTQLGEHVFQCLAEKAKKSPFKEGGKQAYIKANDRAIIKMCRLILAGEVKL